MRYGISACDKVAVISQNTKKVAMHAGVPHEKIAIIYLGIDPPGVPKARRSALKARLKPTRHSIRARQNPPQLRQASPPKRHRPNFWNAVCPCSIRTSNSSSAARGPIRRAFAIFGKKTSCKTACCSCYLSDEELGTIRREADLFIMPNVPYPNDVEGLWHRATRMHARRHPPRLSLPLTRLPKALAKVATSFPPTTTRHSPIKFTHFFAFPPKNAHKSNAKPAIMFAREFTWDKTTAEYLDLFVKA